MHTRTYFSIYLLAGTLSVGGCAGGQGVDEAIGGGPPDSDSPTRTTTRFSAWSGGDTQIDEYDFEEAVRSLRLFQRWDEDGSGAIDMAEFGDRVFMIWDVDDSGAIEADELAAADEDWYRKGLTTGSFEEWDSTDDGAIDKLECRQGLADTRLMLAWDRDRNRFIDRGEFADGAFAVWDTSDDGAIQRDEWERGVERWFEPRPVARGDAPVTLR